MFWIRLRSSIILVIAALFLLLTGDWVLAAGLFVLSLIAFRAPRKRGSRRMRGRKRAKAASEFWNGSAFSEPPPIIQSFCWRRSPFTGWASWGWCSSE